jgi:THO complex subunit 2
VKDIHTYTRKGFKMSLPLLECKYVTEEFVREGKNGNYGTKLPSSVPMLRFLYELSWILVYTQTPPSLPTTIQSRVYVVRVPQRCLVMDY